MPYDLSVIIITKNEQDNLERCLRSLPQNSEIIVVDSFSTDSTLDIAKRWHCITYQRHFTSHADQKNFALSKANCSWVLSIDADEQLLGWDDKILEQAQKSGHQAFYISRRLSFMTKTLRFGKTKDKPLRLYRRAEARYEGSIHEVVQVPRSKPRLLKGPTLLHYSYKNLEDYFERFNYYTSAIATNHLNKQKSVFLFSHLLRPWVEFFNRYVLRLGFLDGYPGYTYALISSLYTYIKYAKLIEKRNHL